MTHTRPKRFTNWFLREWMDTLGVTQADLIRLTDYNKTAISLLCDDRQDYKPPIIRDLAKALNLAPYELLMHPDDAMALRRQRDSAVEVVKVTEHLRPANDLTGTDG